MNAGGIIHKLFTAFFDKTENFSQLYKCEQLMDVLSPRCKFTKSLHGFFDKSEIFVQGDSRGRSDGEGLIFSVDSGKRLHE